MMATTCGEASLLYLVVLGFITAVYTNHTEEGCTCECRIDREDLRAALREVLPEVGSCGSNQGQVIADCTEVPLSPGENEVAWIHPVASETGFHVFCEWDEGGAWTVIQQRKTRDSFAKPWVDYRDGFGLPGESNSFWMGLERMHLITQQKIYTLRIDLEDFDGNTTYVENDRFEVADATNNYGINFDRHSMGNASMALYNDTHFSTMDRDNDWYDRTDCSNRYDSSGWWFRGYYDCSGSNLNGVYVDEEPDYSHDHGIIWWADNTESNRHSYYKATRRYRRASMKIRPTYMDDSD